MKPGIPAFRTEKDGTLIPVVIIQFSPSYGEGCPDLFYCVDCADGKLEAYSPENFTIATDRQTVKEFAPFSHLFV